MPGQTWDKSDSDSHPLRQTCALMGCEFVGTDHFIWCAIEWLARRTDSLDIVRAGDSWRVSGDSWTGEAMTLPLALAAAIQSHHVDRCERVGRE